MVGWRYNLVAQVFEIAPFYNVNKVRILPNENPLSPGYEVIQVPADQTFTYTVDYTGVTISYGGRTVFKPYPEGLTPNVWTAARVSGWFGGNEAAPDGVVLPQARLRALGPLAPRALTRRISTWGDPRRSRWTAVPSATPAPCWRTDPPNEHRKAAGNRPSRRKGCTRTPWQ